MDGCVRLGAVLPPLFIRGSSLTQAAIDGARGASGGCALAAAKRRILRKRLGGGGALRLLVLSTCLSDPLSVVPGTFTSPSPLHSFPFSVLPSFYFLTSCRLEPNTPPPIKDSHSPNKNLSFFHIMIPLIYTRSRAPSHKGPLWRLPTLPSPHCSAWCLRRR